MNARTLVKSAQLRDGRVATVAHVDAEDAEELIGYLETIGGESDFLTFGLGEFGVTEDEEVAYIRGIYANNSGFLLKATIDNQLASVAGIQRPKRPRIAHVGVLGLSVRQKFWNVGVGRLMCSAAIAEGRQMGLQRIELKVRTDNAHAIHLYESLGFVTEGILKRGFAVDDTFFDESLMALLLD